MTQKELLYVEDAIEHEKTIIEVLKFSVEQLEDEELSEYLSNEITTHEKMKTNLCELLKENANV